MAGVRTFLQNIKIIKTTPTVCSIFVPKHGMSQYPSYYINPVHKKEDLDEIYKSGEIQKLMHVPTKAALSDQTCSASQDNLVNLFVNYIMKDGRKILARSLVETAFANIKRMQLEKYHKATADEHKAKIELDPRKIFYLAIENSKPLLNLTPIKRGGVRYQVPIPISGRKSQFLSMKWLISAANEKEGTTKFHVQLARELIDAANNTGRVIKRKHDLHRQCEANRAYAHYRWS